MFPTFWSCDVIIVDERDGLNGDFSQKGSLQFLFHNFSLNESPSFLPISLLFRDSHLIKIKSMRKKKKIYENVL